MSKKPHFLLKYGTRDHIMNHFNSIKPNDFVSYDMNLSKSHALTSDDIDALTKHPNEQIASKATADSRVTPSVAMETPHPKLRRYMIAKHASVEQLNDIAKSKDPHERSIAIDAVNTNAHHIKTVLKHSEPYDRSKNYDYYSALGKAMIRHDVHAPIKTVTDNKPTTYIDHEELANHLLSGGTAHKKMKKDWHIEMPSVSSSNAGMIFTSHPDHVNAALQGTNDRFGASSIDGTYHLLLSHPKLSDETLRKFGTHAASLHHGEFSHTAAISAASHKNASPETKKAIAAAMPDSSPYKRQITRIAERA